jgi:hypothetical protein
MEQTAIEELTFSTKYLIAFHNTESEDHEIIGKLFIKNGIIAFDGDTDKSAKILMDQVLSMANSQLQAKHKEEIKADKEVIRHTIARAIRVATNEGLSSASANARIIIGALEDSGYEIIKPKLTPVKD